MTKLGAYDPTMDKADADKKQGVNSILNVVERFFKHHKKLKEGTQNEQIKEVWQEAMGDFVAKKTDKIYLTKGGMLHLRFTSPSLKNNLWYQKTEIEQKLKGLLEKRGIGFIKIYWC